MTKNIILIHMSSQNSDKELFKKEIARATGRPVFIGAKGLELYIGQEIF